MHDLSSLQLARANGIYQTIDPAAGQRGNRDSIAAADIEVLATIGLVVHLDDAACLDAQIFQHRITDGALVFELRVADVDDMQHEIGGYGKYFASIGLCSHLATIFETPEHLARVFLSPEHRKAALTTHL